MTRIEAKRKELLRLLQELRRTKGAFRRAILREEIRAVVGQLTQLEEHALKSKWSG